MSHEGDKKRLAILRFIANHVERRGFSPTTSEIATAMGFRSKATVWEHTNKLEQRGLIERGGRRGGLHLPLTPGFETVPVVWCDACQQQMPADHECPAPSVEALIRAVQDDYRRYGSPNDLDGGA